MGLDKSLWYPEVANHGYFLEEDGIHRRSLCISLSPQEVVDIFKERGVIPTESELCVDEMPMTDGKFLVEVKHKSFDSIAEGCNIPIICLK